MEEFQDRHKALLKKIDNMPRTENETDETNLNKFKESVAMLNQIEEQTARISGYEQHKEEIKELRMQLAKTKLSLVTLGHSYRPSLSKKSSGFRQDFFEASLEAIKLADMLNKSLEGLKKT